MYAADNNFYQRGPKFDSVEAHRNNKTYYMKLAVLFAVTIGEKSYNLVYLDNIFCFNFVDNCRYGRLWKESTKNAENPGFYYFNSTQLEASTKYAFFYLYC